MLSLLGPHIGSRTLYGLHNLIVSSTPANVASQGKSYFVACRVRILLKERVRAHDYSRGAISALDSAIVDHGSLQRMKFPVSSRVLAGGLCYDIRVSNQD